MGSCLSTDSTDAKAPTSQPEKVTPAAPASKPAAATKPPPAAAPVKPVPAPATLQAANGPSSSKVKVRSLPTKEAFRNMQLLPSPSALGHDESFESTYGHIYQLAQAEKEGVESVPGVQATLLQIPETLPDEVLAKMHGAPKPNVPLVTAAALTEADGILLGFPTRYGSPPAQFKAFWDSTGQLWQKGSLVGKTGGFFFSTATQGGGQETTAWTTITQLVHHGMIYVPLGYTAANGVQFQVETAQGGSPYGAGTLAAGDGSRQPSETELAIARHQGKMFAETTKRIALN